MVEREIEGAQERQRYRAGYLHTYAQIADKR